eukprot:357011-Chlamydomonas_euryale.AAC.2
MARVLSWGKPKARVASVNLLLAAMLGTLSSCNAGHIVILPCIRVNLTEPKKSYPVHPFAMTINKSQGQTFSRMGMFLLCLAIRAGNFTLHYFEWGALMEFTCSSPTYNQRRASQVKAILAMLFTKSSSAHNFLFGEVGIYSVK